MVRDQSLIPVYQVGGIGIKNPMNQGIRLVVKWLLKSFDVVKPLKVMIRNNICNVVPKNKRE